MSLLKKLRHFNLNFMNYFEESQSFISKWTIAFAVLLLGFLSYRFLEGGNLSLLVENIGFWIMLLIFIALFSIRLKTTYDAEGIHIHFIPFVFNRVYKWEEMDEAYLRKYSLMDYGGWGYRFGSDGLAITTSGNKGLQLKFKTGKKVLIGTQDTDAVQRVLDYYLSQERRKSDV